MVKKLTDLQTKAQVTAYESQLVRSLQKKGAKEKTESVKKYALKYAKVKPSDLHPALKAAVDEHLK